MRNKILQLIEQKNKSLSAIEIMDYIKKDSTAEDLRELTDELDSLCREGILRTTNGNGYVKNELLTGKVDMHEKGNAHVIVKGYDDIFISKDKLNGALDGDTVIVDILKKSSRQYDVTAKQEGRITRVLNRSIGSGIGIISKVDGVSYVYPLKDDYPYQLSLKDYQDNNYLDGQIVHLKYEKDLSKSMILVSVDEVLGHKDDPDDDLQIAILAAEHHRSLKIPEEVELEAENYPSELDQNEVNSELEAGILFDRRNELVTTMDGKDTKDIDDATFSERLPNGNIHEVCFIADVERYVKYGSAAWKYAEEKCFTDYYLDKSAPMLSRILSNGICSLNPNEDRYAITVDYELTNNGEVLNPKVYFSVIKSKMKTNYDAVEDIINDRETEDTLEYKTVIYTCKKGETPRDVAFKNDITVEELLSYNEGIKPDDDMSLKDINVPIKAVIKMEYKASLIMKNKLAKRGKLEFAGSNEARPIFDENRHVIDRVPRIQRSAERIIENKMIFANEVFTAFMIEKLSEVIPHNIPYIFRTHGEPNPKKLEDFMNLLKAIGINYPHKLDPCNVSNKDIADLIEFLSEKDNFKVLSNKLLRCMQHARYTFDSNNRLHFALANKLGYTHFTAPIRRLSDLILQTLFRVFIIEKDYRKETIDFWSNYIVNICETINEAEKNNEELEYATQDYADADYMTSHIGEEFTATISEALPQACYILTDDEIEGRVEFTLSEEDSETIKKIESIEEKIAYIEDHKKLFDDIYDKNIYGYKRGGKISYQIGDRVTVNCIEADPIEGKTGFALVRKSKNGNIK